jgi:diguanylate cyclase (GGDEF)-like protein/PAS domain S-box-containing protein
MDDTPPTSANAQRTEADTFMAQEEMKSPPVCRHTEIPASMLEVWQRLLDLVAEVLHVPAALIMRVHAREIEVFLRSRNTENVYERGERAQLETGLYCETVMASRQPLAVPNALKDPAWDHNPDIKLGMISYLGFPLVWPTGEVFGTMCVLDSQERHFSSTYIRLLEQFKDAVEHDLWLFDASLQLQHSETRYRTIFNSVLDAVFVTRPDGTIVDANEVAARQFGFGSGVGIGEIPGLRIENLILTDISWDQDILPQVRACGVFRFEGQAKGKDGTLAPVDVQVASMRLGEEELYVTVAHDIRQRKQLEQELDRLAITDHLTGIGNRAGLERALDWELNQADRYLRPLTVAMMDIDHFKAVNDRLGHEAGDHALTHVCSVTASVLRHADLFFRYGGEEFIVLLPETTLDGASHLAERIRAAVAAASLPEVGRLTVSIGVTQFHPGESRDELIARADVALYKAKSSGRNSVTAI